MLEAFSFWKPKSFSEGPCRAERWFSSFARWILLQKWWKCRKVRSSTEWMGIPSCLYRLDSEQLVFPLGMGSAYSWKKKTKTLDSFIEGEVSHIRISWECCLQHWQHRVYRCCISALPSPWIMKHWFVCSLGRRNILQGYKSIQNSSSYTDVAALIYSAWQEWVEESVSFTATERQVQARNLNWHCLPVSTSDLIFLAEHSNKC